MPCAHVQCSQPCHGQFHLIEALQQGQSLQIPFLFPPIALPFSLALLVMVTLKSLGPHSSLSLRSMVPHRLFGPGDQPLRTGRR